MHLATILPIAAGPFAGSVAAVLARRLPAGRPVAIARSACESCGCRLAAWDMVPLASFVMLRGRCRTCHAPIAPDHLLMELAGAALAMLAVLSGVRGAQLWTACVLGWGLLPLAVIDWRHLRLPDVLTLPLLLVGLAATAWLDPASLTDHTLAAATGYAAFRLLAAGYQRLRGRAGLGQGDAKLAAAAGAWVGLAGLSGVVLIGALLAFVFGIVRIAIGRAGPTKPIPLGPFLAFGLVLMRFFFGP